MNCIFCKIVEGTIPSVKLYEDDHVLAFMDIRPVSRGHSLVIPKKHVRNFLDADTETIAKTVEPLGRVVDAVKKAVGADGIVVSTNNEAAAGQEVFHFHWHIIPRFEGDNFSRWPHHESTSEELAALGEKMRASF